MTARRFNSDELWCVSQARNNQTERKMKRGRGRPRGSKTQSGDAVQVPDSPVLNVPETAAFLRISKSLVHEAIKRGELKALRIGDRILFSRAYIESLIEAR
jgi:excisionase family DNA binding protein